MSSNASMRRYYVGDVVKIKPQKELDVLYNLNRDAFGEIIELSHLDEIAEHCATVVDIDRSVMSQEDFDSKPIGLMLDEAADLERIYLPAIAFDLCEQESNYSKFRESTSMNNSSKDTVGCDLSIKERVVDGSPPRQSIKRDNSFMSQDLDDEAICVQTLAAESIQTAYRCYRDCKKPMKSRRIASTENLVLNLAAETITNSLRRMSSKKKLKREFLKSSDLSKQEGVESYKELHQEDASQYGSDIENISLEAGSKVSSKPSNSKISSNHREQRSPPKRHQKQKPLFIASPLKDYSCNTGWIIRVSHLSVEGIPNVCWRGRNALFCTMNLSTDQGEQWHYRTPTAEGAGDKAAWSDMKADVPIPISWETDQLIIGVYHDTLAIADKLIGSGEIALLGIQALHNTPALHKGSVIPDEDDGDEIEQSQDQDKGQVQGAQSEYAPQTVYVPLYEGTKIKRKDRGTAAITFTVTKGEVKPDSSRSAVQLGEYSLAGEATPAAAGSDDVSFRPAVMRRPSLLMKDRSFECLDTFSSSSAKKKSSNNNNNSSNDNSRKPATAAAVSAAARVEEQQRQRGKADRVRASGSTTVSTGAGTEGLGKFSDERLKAAEDTLYASEQPERGNDRTGSGGGRSSNAHKHPRQQQQQPHSSAASTASAASSTASSTPSRGRPSAPHRAGSFRSATATATATSIGTGVNSRVNSSSHSQSGDDDVPSSSSRRSAGSRGHLAGATTPNRQRSSEHGKSLSQTAPTGISSPLFEDAHAAKQHQQHKHERQQQEYDRRHLEGEPCIKSKAYGARSSYDSEDTRGHGVGRDDSHDDDDNDDDVSSMIHPSTVGGDTVRGSVATQSRATHRSLGSQRRKSREEYKGEEIATGLEVPASTDPRSGRAQAFSGSRTLPSRATPEVTTGSSANHCGYDNGNSRLGSSRGSFRGAADPGAPSPARRASRATRASTTSSALASATAAAAASAAVAGTTKSKADPFRARGDFVVDEAFRLALKRECSCLRLSLRELLAALRKMGYAVKDDDAFKGGREEKGVESTGGGESRVGDDNDSLSAISDLERNQPESGVYPYSRSNSYGGGSGSIRSTHALDEVVELPVLHAMSLAATVSFLMRDLDLLQHSARHTTVITEAQSDKLLRHLVSVVQGSYADARSTVLLACEGSTRERAEGTMIALRGNAKPPAGSAYISATSGKLDRDGSATTAAVVLVDGREGRATGRGRPAVWAPRWVQRLCRALHLDLPSLRAHIHDMLGKASPTSTIGGSELLEMDSSAIFTAAIADPSLSPGLLRSRFVVYQNTLRYIDSWWDKGVRPEDVFHSNSNSPDDPQGNDGEGVGWGGGRGGLPASSARPGGSGEGQAVDVVFKPTSSKRRSSSAGTGKMGNSLRRTSVAVGVHAGGEAPPWGVLDFDQSGGSSNDELGMASGAGVGEKRSMVNLHHLVDIAEFQVLMQALVSMNRAYSWGCSIDSLTLFASNVGGMQMYLVRDIRSVALPDETIREHLMSEDVGRWGLLRITSAHTAGELYKIHNRSRDVRIICKYVLKEDEYLIFIPLSCLRVASQTQVSDGAAMTHPDNNSIDASALAPGVFVRISNLSALQRTCERFDWWDAPPLPVLEKMAGQVGEIVSVDDLQQMRRVGVKVLGNGNICDALPVEALQQCSEVEARRFQDEIEAKKIRDADKAAAQIAKAEKAVAKASRRKSIASNKSANRHSRDRRQQTDEVAEALKNLKRQYQDEKKNESGFDPPSPAGRKKSHSARADAAAATATAEAVAKAKSKAIAEQSRKNSMDMSYHGDDAKSEISNLSAVFVGPPQVQPPPSRQPLSTYQLHEQEQGQEHQESTPWLGMGPVQGDECAPPPPLDLSRDAEAYNSRATAGRGAAAGAAGDGSAGDVDLDSTAGSSPTSYVRPIISPRVVVTGSKGGRSRGNGAHQAAGEAAGSSATEETYSWFRPPQRSPLRYEPGIGDREEQAELEQQQQQHGGVEAAKGAAQAHSPLHFRSAEHSSGGRRHLASANASASASASPARPTLKVVQARFDSANAQFTEGVYRGTVRSSDDDDGDDGVADEGEVAVGKKQQQHKTGSPTTATQRTRSAAGPRSGKAAARTDDRSRSQEGNRKFDTDDYQFERPVGGQQRSGYAAKRSLRPKSAPGTGSRTRGSAAVACDAPRSPDQTTRFGVSGLGYSEGKGGALQAHPNLWFNDDIPAEDCANVTAPPPAIIDMVHAPHGNANGSPPRAAPQRSSAAAQKRKTQTLFEYSERRLNGEPQHDPDEVIDLFGLAGTAVPGTVGKTKGATGILIQQERLNKGAAAAFGVKQWQAQQQQRQEQESIEWSRGGTVRIPEQPAPSRPAHEKGGGGGGRGVRPTVNHPSATPASAGAAESEAKPEPEPGYMSDVHISFGVEVNKKNKDKPANRESELYYRATAQSHRAEKRKEDVLKRELKKLGVHMP